MYPFPVRLPPNLKLSVSQPYHSRIPVDLSKALSVQTIDHIGVDVICGTPQQTWGQACVWPFPFPGTVWTAEVDSLFGATQHAHSQIDGTDPNTGIKYGLVYLHLSAVTKQKSEIDTQVIIYNQGDVIGRVGNNGVVSPLPTSAAPYNSSHLHLGVGVKKPGEINYTMVDPQTIFDVSTWFVGNYQFTRDLFMGIWGNDVIELQKRLGIAPTWGGFGPQTYAKLKAWQAINNLPATGYFGPLSRAKMNA